MHGSHVRFYGFSYVLQTFAVTILYTKNDYNSSLYHLKITLQYQNYLMLGKVQQVELHFYFLQKTLEFEY